MLRVAVVGSDQKTRDQLADMIHRAAQSRGMEVEVKIFDRPKHFLFCYEPVYDMIYLEAEFPLSSVPEIVKRLRKRSGNMDLIFLTDKGEHGDQLQEGGVLAFIPKLPTEERFKTEFLRAVERMISSRLDQILLKTSEGTVRLNVRQIYYLETHDRMLYYHTAVGTFSVRKSMLNAQQELEGYSFAKCNQCYLVNLSHVSDVRDNCVVVGERQLEISRRNKKSFMDAIIAHIGQT